MFGRRVTLFKLFDFEVRIDVSWIIIAVLITWSLAEGFFPHYYKNLSSVAYVWMGVMGALGLFASIIAHELSHSLIARKFGLPIRGITLFIFGGVAEMADEPPSAQAEFFMAIAGPITSILIGLVCHGIYIWAHNNGWSVALIGIFNYLRWINWVLAVFNLLPAFPLDGGRIFRSILWRWKGNLQWATRISTQIGAGFGFVLSFMGILYIISGVFITGIWWLLIGFFLRNASQMSYQRVLVNRVFEGESVRRFLKPNPVIVPVTLSIAELVDEYIYKYHFKMFPVVKDKKLLGCISTREVKEIPRGEWNQHTVGEVFKACSPANTITADIDATKALSIMNRTGNSRLMVVEDDKLIGIITLKDLLLFLSLKIDLEGKEFEKK